MKELNENDSLRIKKEILEKVKKIAIAKNSNIDNIVNILLEYSLNNLDEDDKKIIEN